LPFADAASCFGVAAGHRQVRQQVDAAAVEVATARHGDIERLDRRPIRIERHIDARRRAGARTTFARPRTRPPATANSTSSSATRPDVDDSRARTDESGGVSGSCRLSVLSSTPRSTPGTAANGNGVSPKRGPGAFAGERPGSPVLLRDAGMSFVTSIDFDASTASTRGRAGAVLNVMRPSTVWPGDHHMQRHPARSCRPAY
jgi:hypothetical protein